MEYNEKTAQEIQREHGLKEGVIRLWKHRGKIPNRYFQGYEKGKRATQKELAFLERLIGLPFIAKGCFQSIALQKIMGFERGGKHARITHSEIKDLKKEVIEIKNVLRKLMKKPTSENLAATHKEKRIKVFQVIDGNQKLYHRIRKATKINESDAEILKNHIEMALTKLKIT